MNRILVLRLRRCRWQQQQRGPRKILDSTSSMMAILILVSTMILLFLSEGVVVTEGFGWSNSNSNSIRTTNHKMNSVTTTTTTNGDAGGASVIVTPRAVAVFALMESMKKKNGIAIRLLENNPAYRHLDRRDRAFARLLLSTSERRSGQLERIIRSFQHKNKNNKNNDDKQENKKKKMTNKKPRLSDLLTEAALRIGATQLLFMDTPVYAAVSETVESLRMHPKITVSKSQISYVNAVLRTIDREGREKLDKDTSIMDNVDPWLAQQWLEQYGPETTTTIVEAAMSQSPIFITVNQNHQHEEEDRIERLEQIKDLFTTIDDETDGDPIPAERLPIGSIRVPDNFGGTVSKWPLYEDGAWWVQDVSATLPAIALFNTLSHQQQSVYTTSMHVVDLCAAPGGKTAQLCSYGFGRVDAIEYSEKRSRSLQQNLQRLHMQDICNVIIADGRDYVPTSSSSSKNNDDNDNRSAGPPTTTVMKVQGVLIDAPCSATGVGSRRPDVLRKDIELEHLTTMQRELCVQAVDHILAVNGVLVYATCSLLKQEGEEQIEQLLSCYNNENNKSNDVQEEEEDEEHYSASAASSVSSSSSSSVTLETIPFTPGELPGFDECIDENGWLRVIPGVLPGSLHYCDGFFVARLRKKVQGVNDPETST